jgi:hypothetical protein
MSRLCFLSFLQPARPPLGAPQWKKNATSAEIKAFFASAKKTVLTFVGYSGAGYQDEASMLQQAERILGEFDPTKQS